MQFIRSEVSFFGKYAYGLDKYSVIIADHPNRDSPDFPLLSRQH